MVDTLTDIYSRDELEASLKANPLQWSFDDWKWQLYCGDFIVAAVWPQTTGKVTWRTAWCGAHNTATGYTKGRKAAEEAVRKHAA
jgi:hypothetical protein